MRCARVTIPSIRPAFFCGQCCCHYQSYETLVKHLYWRHGTESRSCTRCGLRMWSFAKHLCEVIPSCGGIEEETAVDIVVDDCDRENSRPESVDSQYFSDRDSDFCYCGRMIEGSDMIGCDGSNCHYEWFHYHCVGVIEVPKGSWYCPDCAKNKKTFKP